MKLATWNVNSLRVRLDQVLAWLVANPVDVLAVQETKLTDERFPGAEFAAAGYHACFTGQPTYNGVALLSRAPPAAILTDPPGIESGERRIIAATYGTVRVVNLYVINGQEVGSGKYARKLAWLHQVGEWLAAEARRHPRLLVAGDFNIAPGDADVHDPAAWHERILCSSAEREALGRLMDKAGIDDCFRRFVQPPGSFSWWDYRQAAWRRNRGLRIDLILAPPGLRCAACTIDRAPRAWERPSDHAPVIAEFVFDTE